MTVRGRENTEKGREGWMEEAVAKESESTEKKNRRREGNLDERERRKKGMGKSGMEERERGEENRMTRAAKRKRE